MKLLKQVIIQVFRRKDRFLNVLLLRYYRVRVGRRWKIKGTIQFRRGKGTITIGDDFKANSGSHHNPIGGDSKLRLIAVGDGHISIGSNVGISNSTFVSRQSIIIGNHVRIGGGCRIWDNDFHSLDPLERTNGGDEHIGTKAIIVSDYAFVGGGSIITKGVTVGTGAIVAAGSVVTKDIPPFQIWGGNPATKIREQSGASRDQIEKEERTS